LLAHSRPGTVPVEVLPPEAELAAIRARGYSFDDEEYLIGLRCVAVPVRDHSGEVRYALATSGPAQRVGADRVPLLVAALRRTAGAMEHALGCRAAPATADTAAE